MSSAKKSSETIPLYQYILLETELKNSQNNLEKLKIEILTKENHIEDLTFLLEESKSRIMENKEDRHISSIIEVIKTYIFLIFFIGKNF